MHVSTLTISSKGQIVLPKKICKLFNSNIISLVLNNKNQVILTPIHELGGSLSSYNKKSDLVFNEIRESAWKENIETKINNQKLKTE